MAGGMSVRDVNGMHLVAAGQEKVWVEAGMAAEVTGDLTTARDAYLSALRHNRNNPKALRRLAIILRAQGEYTQAIDICRELLVLEQDGEVWAEMGHCFLMSDDLQNSFLSFQQALVLLPNPKMRRLWYGIGVLYERYGSLDLAEEAYRAVLTMSGFQPVENESEGLDGKMTKHTTYTLAPDVPFSESAQREALEIFYRLGIICRKARRFDDALNCFEMIVANPPEPLTAAHVWVQIGQVFEMAKAYEDAKGAYERALDQGDEDAIALQRLGWIHSTEATGFKNIDTAVALLTRSVAADENDAHTRYLLGLCAMERKEFSEAYSHYQQAVGRDDSNPTYWTSIGILYNEMNQSRDALDCFVRAISLSPTSSDILYSIGWVYECSGQLNDALEFYRHAAVYAPKSKAVRRRIRKVNADLRGDAPEKKKKKKKKNLKQDGEGALALMDAAPTGGDAGGAPDAAGTAATATAATATAAVAAAAAPVAAVAAVADQVTDMDATHTATSGDEDKADLEIDEP